jgi:hypothetical protein
MPATMSPEMDRWLADRQKSEAEVQRAAQLWDDGNGPRRVTSPAWTHGVEFTEAEWRWLWKRFQPVHLPVPAFGRRLQASTTDVMSLSPEQRRWVLALVFKFRRQVFFNPRAGLLNEECLVVAIKQLAAKDA